MRTHLARSHERNRLDVRVVAQGVDHVFAAVNHVQHASRDARLQGQAHEFFRHQRILLRWLQHEGIAAGNRHREHPQRDHGGEVERGNAGAHAQRLHHAVGIDATGHVLRVFTHLQGADIGSMLDHFQAAEHVAFRVEQGLALFHRQGGSQVGHVFADQLLQFEENARACADRRLAPGLEGALGGGDGGIDFVGRGKRHTRQHFLRGRIDDVAPDGGLGFNPLAVDQQWNGRNSSLRGHSVSPGVGIGLFALFAQSPPQTRRENAR